MSPKMPFGATGGSGRSRIARPAQPAARVGTRASGRIVKLLVGQGHGYIRLASDREIYFHRADVAESTRFNQFRVGDQVRFELFEDPVSGPRALRVACLARER